MKGYCVNNRIQQLKAKGFQHETMVNRLNLPGANTAGGCIYCHMESQENARHSQV